VYAQAMSVSKEEAFDLFKEFQQQEPKHVNTYYQLALLSSYWMQQYNPILQYSEVALHTYNAKLYFGLAKYNLTERNASEDDEFYQTTVPLKPGKMQYGILSSI
jgi:hypothetical protein